MWKRELEERAIFAQSIIIPGERMEMSGRSLLTQLKPKHAVNLI